TGGGTERAGCGLGVIGLDAEEDQVGDAGAARVVRGRACDDEVAVGGRLDTETVLADRFQMGSPRDERDGLARAAELGAEVASDAAGPHDQDVHGDPWAGPVPGLRERL